MFESFVYIYIQRTAPCIHIHTYIHIHICIQGADDTDTETDTGNCSGGGPVNTLKPERVCMGVEGIVGDAAGVGGEVGRGGGGFADCKVEGDLTAGSDGVLKGEGEGGGGVSVEQGQKRVGRGGCRGGEEGGGVEVDVSPRTPPTGSPAGKKGSPNLKIQTDGLKVDKDKEVAEPARTPHRHKAVNQEVVIFMCVCVCVLIYIC
jgi:hypothetical protein